MSDEVRTDAEKAQMYSAILGGANVITSVLDANNDYYNDMTNEEKKEKVMRSAGYLEFGVALKDWGSEDFTAINSAIAAAKAYSA